MMKTLLLILFLLQPVYSDIDWNKWNDSDKQFFMQRDNISHIVINTAIVYGTMDLARYSFDDISDIQVALIGLTTGLAFGYIKESYVDKNFDKTDMQSWAFGSFSGTMINLIVWKF